jgi:hypothetical protein
VLPHRRDAGIAVAPLSSPFYSIDTQSFLRVRKKKSYQSSISKKISGGLMSTTVGNRKNGTQIDTRVVEDKDLISVVTHHCNHKSILRS